MDPAVLSLQAATRIKYVTDGLLLREMMDDPLLTKYRYSSALLGDRSAHVWTISSCCNADAWLEMDTCAMLRYATQLYRPL